MSTGEAHAFPWATLMQLFLGARGLAPEAFWGLTMPEIHAVLAHLTPAGGVAPPRAALDALIAAFPDRS